MSESGLPALGPWNKKFNWELSWEQRSSRIARFIKNSRVYSPDYKIDFYSLVWSTSRWPRKPEAQNVYHWRWAQSLLCPPIPSPSTLATGTAWVHPDSLVITCNIWVQFLSLDFAFLPIVSNRGKYKGWRLTLFTRREKTANKPKKKSIMEFLLNNSRAKPSTSSISQDPVKNPMNSVCNIIFIVGGTKLCLRSSQPYILLLLRTNNWNHWILSRDWLHFIWLHFV